MSGGSKVSKFLPPWKLYLLGASFALSLGVAVAALLLVGRNPPEEFHAADIDAIGIRIKDAQVELRRGDPEVAVERLERLRHEDPLNPMIHALLGQALARDAETLTEGIAATRMAVTLDPLFTDAWYNLACYYARAGDQNGAIWSLAEAVAVGFEDRQALAADADLKLVREDPRVAFFLDGHGFPAEKRFAKLHFEPEKPNLGEAFEMVITLWGLDMPVESQFSLAFLGGHQSKLIQPLERKLQRLPSSRPTQMGWELRYKMAAWGPYSGAVGPWDLRVGDARVPITVQPLRVILPEHAQFEDRDETYEIGSFFSAPF